MTPRTHSDPLGEEVRAALAARRDVGPGYDDYFVESLVRNLTQRLTLQTSDPSAQAPIQRAKPARDPRLVSSRQRLFLAIASLAALAIVAGLFAASDWGILGFLVASAAIGAINVLFART